MPTPELSLELCQERVSVVESCLGDGFRLHGTPGAVKEAARRAGISEGALRHTLKFARERYQLQPDASRYIPKQAEAKPKRADKEPLLPTFPDADIPVEEIIGHLKARVEQKKSRERAELWFPIKMPDNQPFALCVFGDPHLGTHTNWSQLEEDVAICRDTPGMWGVNIGDTVDNWPLFGRLSRLWAENDISMDTERQLVRWFFGQVPWLIWLLGNHDLWNMMGPWIKQVAQDRDICPRTVPVMDEEARFIMHTPNGMTFPIWARHDFPGHSQFNDLHGAMRALREKANVDAGTHILGVEGHKHHWSMHEEETAHKGYFFTVARARGYKWVDEYATHLGHDSQEYGASLVYVCNPEARRLSQQTTIWKDVEEGANYLTYLRGRSKTGS